MPVVAHDGVVLTVFNLGAGEIVLILALVFILIGRKKLPDLLQGLGHGLSEFGKASREISDALDDEAVEAGRALGGIYGKPAAQALTPDNHVAELYDPAVFYKRGKPFKRRHRLKSLLRRFWRRLGTFLQLKNH